MPLGVLRQIPQTLPSFPVRGSPERLVYLGINITPSKFYPAFWAHSNGFGKVECSPHFLDRLDLSSEDENSSRITSPHSNDSEQFHT